MKVKEALFRGSQSLEGLPSPRLDSEVLLMHLLNLDRTQLYLAYERELSFREEKLYQELLGKRLKRVPVAYLIGKKEFMSLEFQVDSRVLIPRPETELLVEAVLAEIAKYSPRGQVLDLGTGSGAIALSLAFYCPDSLVFALDYSPAALEVAQKNALALGLGKRVRFLLGDLWEGLPKELQNQCFQVIVSNPPYISQREMEVLEREVAEYEPYLALRAGEDGLDFYRRISQGLPFYLAPGGLVALEVGRGQAFWVQALLKEQGIFAGTKILEDYAGIARIVLAWREN